MIALPVTMIALPARAGGGHSFSGGGGGGDSFSGGGGGTHFFGGGVGGGGGGGGGIIGLIVIVVIVVAIVLALRSRRRCCGWGGAPATGVQGGQPGERPPPGPAATDGRPAAARPAPRPAAGAARSGGQCWQRGPARPPRQAPPERGPMTTAPPSSWSAATYSLAAPCRTRPRAGTVQTVSDGLGAIVDHDPNFDPVRRSCTRPNERSSWCRRRGRTASPRPAAR